MRARRVARLAVMRALYCGDWDVEPRVAEVRSRRWNLPLHRGQNTQSGPINPKAGGTARRSEDRCRYTGPGFHHLTSRLAAASTLGERSRIYLTKLQMDIYYFTKKLQIIRFARPTKFDTVPMG